MTLMNSHSKNVSPQNCSYKRGKKKHGGPLRSNYPRKLYERPHNYDLPISSSLVD